ncbi:nucleoside triphosphate pyrophosphohydrolase [Clostridiaceae bacterium OttesenSCG-928-D20]|nr:nucleoside triphosphate pyrophosphohydrolase [Clostridiaceae bacterium OttesenSCG-928-D20]
MVDFVYKRKYVLSDFLDIMRILRSPEGCPWDREQTHKSVRRNFLEETYEVCEAIDSGDLDLLKEELGDVLMQVILHSLIEEEQGSFNLDDVADFACKKLIRRHPHIFSDVEVENTEQVLQNWDEIKKQEKNQQTASETMESVAKSLPALWRAEKIQKKARKVGFDWNKLPDALAKIDEELTELKDAIESGTGIEEELGDLLFATVNTSRFLNIDPEMALHASCDKFTRRFSSLEKKASEKGLVLEQMTLDEMDELYEIAKSEEEK